MELIQSFIAVAEAAAKQQIPQDNINSAVGADQPTKSQESAVVEALLFNKPLSVVRSREPGLVKTHLPTDGNKNYAC